MHSFEDVERLIEAGDLESAQKRLDDALFEDPKSASTLLQIGALYERCGSHTSALIGAVRAYQSARRADPGDPRGYEGVARSLMEKTPRASALVAKTGLRRADSRPLRWLYAEALTRSDQPKAALAALAALDGTDREELEVLQLVAKTSDLLGDEPKAIDAWRKVLEQAPDHTEANLRLAAQALKQDDRESASRLADRADASARTANERVRVGDLYLSLDDLNAAERNYEVAMVLPQIDQSDHDLSNQLTRACLRLAQLKGQREDWEGAKTVLDKARGQDPTNGRVQLELARVLKKLNMTDAAASALARAAALSPDDHAIQKAVGLAFDEESGDDVSFSGTLDLIPAPELLQFLGSSRASGTLVLERDHEIGKVWLVNGELAGVDFPKVPIAALAQRPINTLAELSEAKVSFTDAAGMRLVQRGMMELLGWTSGRFGMRAESPVTVETVNINFALLDAQRHLDEQGRVNGQT